MELFQSLRISEIPSGFGFRSGTQGSNTQREHIIAELGPFPGRNRDIDIMVEYTESEDQLGQGTVLQDNIRLEMAFRRTHPWKIDAVFGLPVMFLQVTQVAGHHSYIRTPFLQTD